MEHSDKFYSIGTDTESLDEEPGYSIERYVDICWPEQPPKILELVTWKRRKVNIVSYEVLERLVESLDEEYSGEGEWTEPTEAMKIAEEAFLLQIERLYVPWQCEPVKFEAINTRFWLAENNEHLFKEVFDDYFGIWEDSKLTEE